MRTIFGVALLGLSWAVGMGALLIGLDDVLSGARLNGLFLWTGTVMTSTITVELAEEAANWMSKSASKSVALLPPRCHAG
jgi:hypothetical protein